jgi:hypothetical protein
MVVGLRVSPAVFYALTLKLSMEFWSEINCHAELSPQILKGCLLVLKIVAFGKKVPQRIL